VPTQTYAHKRSNPRAFRNLAAPRIQGIIRVGRRPDRVGAALPTLGHLRSYLMPTLLRDQTVRLALVLALGGSNSVRSASNMRVQRGETLDTQLLFVTYSHEIGSLCLLSSS
jgi:hypothetical protein